MDRRFESIDQKFESIDQKFERRFEAVEQQIRALVQEIGNLRQDVGRLQGVVERTYEPERFTRTSAQVREQRPAYGDDPSEPSGSGGDEPES